MVQISEVTWFIEPKGLVTTADKFSDSVYDFIKTLSRDNISFRVCREPERALLGFKWLGLKNTQSFLKNQQQRF
jgi:hypothetical protein